MKAVIFSNGGVSWGEAPDPVPRHGELLVEVHAAALNGADLHQMAGHYPPPPGTRADLGGLECAGVVVGVGSPSGTGGGAPQGEAVPGTFAVGDTVMGLVPGAGQAELAVLHERVALRVPEGLDWPAAGGFTEVFATAHDALFAQAALTPGERLLIQGAAGGVGCAALQLAAALGARVVASVRDERLRDRVAAFGAGSALPVAVVAPDDVAGHGPYDVVLELVGGPNIAVDLASLAPHGRIVVIGIGAGSAAEVDLRQLMARRARIHGSTLRSRSLEDKALVARALERSVLPLLGAGALRVPVAATYPFADVAQAYDRFAAGGKLGKVVLVRD